MKSQKRIRSTIKWRRCEMWKRITISFIKGTLLDARKILFLSKSIWAGILGKKRKIANIHDYATQCKSGAYTQQYDMSEMHKKAVKLMKMQCNKYINLYSIFLECFSDRIIAKKIIYWFKICINVWIWKIVLILLMTAKLLKMVSLELISRKHMKDRLWRSCSCGHFT